jgi:hypothetical protein
MPRNSPISTRLTRGTGVNVAVEAAKTKASAPLNSQGASCAPASLSSLDTLNVLDWKYNCHMLQIHGSAYFPFL